MKTARRQATDALEEVYRNHAQHLWRSLLLWTGSRDVASDAVAEAFAQALRRGQGLSNPAHWVWRAAFRIAAGEMKTWREAQVFEESAYRMEEDMIDVLRALEQLSPHQRAAVVLADYAGYKHREIARILGSSTSAIGVHVHRARRRLRSLLEVSDD